MQPICSWASRHWWVGVLLGIPLFVMETLPPFVQITLGLAGGLILGLGWMDGMGNRADDTLSRAGKAPIWKSDEDES